LPIFFMTVLKTDCNIGSVLLIGNQLQRAIGMEKIKWRS
jgi:hypothetical protein